MFNSWFDIKIALPPIYERVVVGYGKDQRVITGYWRWVHPQGIKWFTDGKTDSGDWDAIAIDTPDYWIMLPPSTPMWVLD